MVNERIEIEILDAAERLFELYGYKKTTIEEIAQEAKIGKGSVYLHFKSKEDIGLCWLSRLHSHIYTSLEETAKGPGTVQERIRELLVRRVELRHDVFRKHRRSMDEALSTLKELCREKRENFHRREAELIAELIREGASKGEVYAKDPSAAGESMILATNSLLPYTLSPQQLGEMGAVMHKAANLADLLIRAIEVKGGDK
jgi:AcrR family transcriptional regulator